MPPNVAFQITVMERCDPPVEYLVDLIKNLKLKKENLQLYFVPKCIFSDFKCSKVKPIPKNITIYVAAPSDYKYEHHNM